MKHASPKRVQHGVPVISATVGVNVNFCQSACEDVENLLRSMSLRSLVVCTRPMGPNDINVYDNLSILSTELLHYTRI